MRMPAQNNPYPDRDYFQNDNNNNLNQNPNNPIPNPNDHVNDNDNSEHEIPGLLHEVDEQRNLNPIPSNPDLNLDPDQNQNNEMVIRNRNRAPQVSLISSYSLLLLLTLLLVKILPVQPAGLVDLDDACVICLHNRRTVILRPCNHRCLCLECARRQGEHIQLEGYSHATNKCPLCRADIVTADAEDAH